MFRIFSLEKKNWFTMGMATSFFKCKHSLTCNGTILDLSMPVVMGIINVTTDSFYGASQFRMKYRIKQRAQSIINQGGTIIDIGACSTRPGSIPVSVDEEIKRLSKALETIRKVLPEAVISVDTFRAEVAKQVVRNFNVNIINDISAGDMDPAMFETIAELNVPYIIMHMRGTPQTMQNNPVYENVVKNIIKYFTEKIDKLKSLGINDILIDPGFGFGKNSDHNFALLKNLEAFSIFDIPIVAGLSRKSMVYKSLETTPEDALNGTTSLNTIALLKGASVLRVHDVHEACEAIKLVGLTQQQQTIE